MKKDKTKFLCSDCGATFSKWLGQCTSCGEWNTINEFKERAENTNTERSRWVSSEHKEFVQGKLIQSDSVVSKVLSGVSEFDNVLGGGITPASVNLISGEPGVGKSTLLIQVICSLNQEYKSGYVSGEESLQQIKSRAKRIGLNDDTLYYLSETCVESIIDQIEKHEIKFVVVDSIQTIYTESSKSAAGSVTQLKESTAKLTNYAKNKGVTILIVGHVTKDGTIAGPKVLEHIIDGVFQIEGDQNSRFRIMRAFKNRFGETNEIGIFAMSEKGMKSVSNPSAMFLSTSQKDSVGSSIMITREGRRSIMYEIQSLVTSSNSDIPQRLAIGINNLRVKMVLAILQKHLRLATYKQDIYISLVGGVQIQQEDTSSDLSLAFSVYSSAEDFIIPKDVCSFGEISLTGEIRPVPFGEDRIKEAAKHGFQRIIIPFSNFSKDFPKKYPDIEIIPVMNISDAINVIKKISKGA